MDVGSNLVGGTPARYEMLVVAHEVTLTCGRHEPLICVW